MTGNEGEVHEWRALCLRGEGLVHIFMISTVGWSGCGNERLFLQMVSLKAALFLSGW